MNMAKWNPWDGISPMGDHIDSIFDDSFPSTDAMETKDTPSTWNPVVDVYETEGAFVIQAELPGLKNEDITVEVKGNVVTLKGEKCFCTDLTDEECRSRESSWGLFHRTFTLPTVIDAEKCRAVFEDGLLELRIQKPETETPRHISITVDA